MLLKNLNLNYRLQTNESTLAQHGETQRKLRKQQVTSTPSTSPGPAYTCDICGRVCTFTATEDAAPKLNSQAQEIHGLDCDAQHLLHECITYKAVSTHFHGFKKIQINHDFSRIDNRISTKCEAVTLNQYQKLTMDK